MDSKAKTDIPEGLDVIPAVPGTFVGGHDVQGTDGKERTDRPGEILGTPALTDKQETRLRTGREREMAKAAYVTAEVDRANREELPKLGGDVDDGWAPGDKVAGIKTIAPGGK